MTGVQRGSLPGSEQRCLEVRPIDFNPGIFGSLNRSARLVNVAKHQDPADEQVVIAHEIGHYRLHRDPHNEVTVRPHGLGGDPIDSGAGRVEGYSPRERKEVQADIFAGEFLCPADWLREEYVNRGTPPARDREGTWAAASSGHEPDDPCVAVAAACARPSRIRRASHVLDASQEAAATWGEGPLLVDAGPGTGKTRTLVRRIKHLLEKGSPSRLDSRPDLFEQGGRGNARTPVGMNADAAIEMWVGTFHAFGLELVTKWPSSVGRTSKVRILDQTGSLALLEAQPGQASASLLSKSLRTRLRACSGLARDFALQGRTHHAGGVSRRGRSRVGCRQRPKRNAKTPRRLQEIAAIYRIYEKGLQRATPSISAT